MRVVLFIAGLLGLSLPVTAAEALVPDFSSAEGPIVYHCSTHYVTNLIPALPSLSYRPPGTNLPPAVRRGLMSFLPQSSYRLTVETNKLFDHFLPESLRNLVWTNLIAHTNGKSTVIWKVRSHPTDWPNSAPLLEWNTDCVMWGRKGLTALSPCWEVEGLPGQVPITALTRRHGYTRGHSMGPEGFRTNLAGKKIWFVTARNQVVEMKVSREVVRTVDTSHRDYTLVLFDRDLPQSIETLRVIDPAEVFGINSRLYPFCYGGGPNPLFETEQGGQVAVGLPGFQVNTWKGGDSGSPNMLPLPDELIFVNGRSTSGASPEMQADMDELCRLEGLDARKYQLNWFSAP